MTIPIEKIPVRLLQDWFENGVEKSKSDLIRVFSSKDMCSAIENVKKGSRGITNVEVNCDKINSDFVGFDLSRQSLVDAMDDEDFHKKLFSKNINGISLASYVSLYYQNWFQEEREDFVGDITF